MYFLRDWQSFSMDWRQMAQLGGDWTGFAVENLFSYTVQPVFEGGQGRAGGGGENCEEWIPNSAQQFASKRAAFRAAKRDAGIPTSQTHITHAKNLKADGLDKRKTATEYDFGGGRKIQDHPAGHKFPDGVAYDKSHFNNHGAGGTKGHYEY